MHDEHEGQNPALTELRERLRGGMVRMGLNQTELAQRAGLGRTTVSEALSPAKPAPSPETVATLARALLLQQEAGALLELRQRGVEGARSGAGSVPGRAIDEWDPHDLEVHPASPGDAASGPGRSGVRAMPAYVRREHDRVLARVVEDASAGRSRAVVLVGGSSTGKTRACWEAVQPLAAQEWRLWHPFDPTRAQDALDDLPRVAPRTVVWLNEAQHYLGDRVAGERIAASVHRLLMSVERGPVLVLGTLWPEYATRYTALPVPNQEDPHSRVRELLTGRTLTVPETFDAPALAAAAALADGGDRLLAGALVRAGDGGRVTQDLAGAPELLNRYRHATPAAAAVLEAAMDARRLSVRLHLPQAFLTDAAADYLTDTDYDQLTEDWAEQAFAELAAPVHGKLAPLRRTTPRTRRRPPAPAPTVHGPPPSITRPVFRLADYLEQHGRASRSHLCPPASFWHAAHTHLTDPDDLNNLTRAAEDRHRLQWAHALRHRAAAHGSPDALARLAMMREKAGQWAGAETLYQQAADHGSDYAVHRLALIRQKAGDQDGLEALAQQAAARGSHFTLYRLALMREGAGDREGAEAFYRQIADHGNRVPLYHVALRHLALMREETGDLKGAEAFALQSFDHGDPDALWDLASRREQVGDRYGAEALYRRLADHGHPEALWHLAVKREAAGDGDGAEYLYRQAAEHGSSSAVLHLAVKLEQAGDRDAAEALALRAPDTTGSSALGHLAKMRERAGDWEGAEALARRSVDHGHPQALTHLAHVRREAGDREGAEALYRYAANHGYPDALDSLAAMREEAGDRAGLDALYQQAIDHGSSYAVHRLARIRQQVGDRDGLEALARRAVDHGHAAEPGIHTTLWPYGLDPDGTPTPSWEASVSTEQSRPLLPGTW
ncbi:hypothetical protein ACFRJ1_14175 [Streptomyces sp. NPDC056773]|uniref:hypothetical protein n=1 Tax=unclassified Streptomyces TaxID=2593676 RepID=UPI003694DAC8